MRPSKRDIIIATRRSELALAQSRQVGQRLARRNPRVDLRLVPIDSQADQIQDQPLARFGGKGLFTKGIERALLAKTADIAVHSLKDLPAEETAGLVIAATPKRMPVHDVLIARDAARIEDLPEGALIGTCSPRRAAQVQRLRPDVRITSLRGNVQTRIRKVMEDRTIDATLLSAAGLLRMGMDGHARNAVPVDQVLPAAGQGAMAVQARGDDHTTMRRCMPLNDADTGAAVNAERQVVAALGADCHSPLAVLAECTEDAHYRLRARVLSLDGRTCLWEDRTEPARQFRALCEDVAQSLIDQGAKQVLREAARQAESG